MHRCVCVAGAWALGYPGHWEGRSGLEPEMHPSWRDCFPSVGTRQPAGKKLRVSCNRGGKKVSYPLVVPWPPCLQAGLPQSSGAFRRASLHCAGLCVCDSVPEGVSGPRWWPVLVCVRAVVCMWVGHTVGCRLPFSRDWGQFHRKGGCVTTSAPAPSQLCFSTGSDSQAGSRSMCMLGWGWGAGQHLLGLSLKVLSWVTERSNCCGGAGCPRLSQLRI